ncbi:MAG: adenosylcobinamide-GDP ribazoletransferase [Thermodesulfobacteriota bacterium]
MIRRFFIAMQFLTVFRFWDNLGETDEDLAASVGLYPVVGLVLGGLLAAGQALFSLFLPPVVTGFLLVFALALLTRGLHLDGLADTADGLFSHQDLAVKLVIMKDSRVGVFGVLALFFILGLKALLLGEAVRDGAYAVVLLFPVWGRLAVSLTAGLSVYARSGGGLGRPFVDLAGRREIFLAGGAALLASFLALGLSGLITGLAVALGAVIGVEVWRRLLGGVTGDILGATAELGEALGLLVAAI